MLRSIALILIISTRAFSLIGPLNPLLDPFDPSIKRTECGGTIRADNHTLSFPGILGESLIPGETCVWTIHLETSRDFRFIFTDFDVNAADTDCSTGGVRLYSISNLFPAGDIEQEVFCSASPPRDTEFYFGGSVAVLVVYSHDSNSRPGSGFTLSWRGSSFDPMLTKHVSSFSTIGSGRIDYPVVGSYEPNLIATWEVNTEPGTQSDLQIQKVSLETCPNPDPCTCDALSLYEIPSGGSGFLIETDRFCSNSSTTINRFNVANTFILAFFTDFHESPGESGFSALYFPSDISGTTTSSPELTTTESLPPTTSQTIRTTTKYPGDGQCGDVIQLYSGWILYKEDTQYGSLERCVFTLNYPHAAGYNFVITEFEPADPLDGIVVRMISRNSSLTISDHHLERGTPETFYGEMAIITFYSNETNQGRGFRLYFNVIGISDTGNDPAFGALVTSDFANVHYPSSTPNYSNNALATHIYAPSFIDHSHSLNYASYIADSLDSVCNCCDNLLAFGFGPIGSSSMGWIPLSPTPIICGNEDAVHYENNDIIMFIFTSDAVNTGSGFLLSLAIGSTT